jgi:hypothetical protein
MYMKQKAKLGFLKSVRFILVQRHDQSKLCILQRPTTTQNFKPLRWAALVSLKAYIRLTTMFVL